VEDVLRRIDEFCNTVPRRWTRTVDDGPLRLFVRTGAGWPYYARPIPGSPRVSVEDVRRMRARQRSLGVPEAFEWVPAQAPTMTDAVAGTGLPVRLCPLLVLDGDPVPTPFPRGCSARLLGPADGDLATASGALNSVAAAAFGAMSPGAPDESAVAALRADLAAGTVARLLVTDDEGPVAAGSAQRAGDVVELVGIGTAQRARGRGIGAAVTSALAGAARSAGAGLVFLAAGDDTATRVYERVGFRRAGECGLTDT
jgi:GNAT superfamily N-acetyltransferase